MNGSWRIEYILELKLIDNRNKSLNDQILLLMKQQFSPTEFLVNAKNDISAAMSTCVVSVKANALSEQQPQKRICFL